MSYETKIAVLGSDGRQTAVARHLGEIYDVSYISDLTDCGAIKSAVKRSDAVVLPLPSSKDGVTITGSDAKISEIIDVMAQGSLLFGGKLPPLTKKYATERLVTAIDYYEDEAVQIKNAVPTAEGAIGIAIAEMKRTLFSSRAVVIGYGRVGRTVANMLLSLKANVTAVARSEKDLAYAEIDGCLPLSLDEYRRLPCEADVTISTVPTVVFTSDVIAKLANGSLIIDLASSPGSVDYEASEKAGIRAVFAPSLPSKTAPDTAGKIIADAVSAIIEREAMA